jgi:hypothetical protein
MTSAGKQAKTLVSGALLMFVAALAPGMALGVIGWHDAVAVATLSGLAAFMACSTGRGWRTGLQIVAPFAVVAGLAVWAAPNPWLAACVMALAAFLRGYAAKVGLHNALMMTVIALGFLVASPPHSNTVVPTPVLVGLVTVGTTLWVTLVFYVLRNRLAAQTLTPIEPVRVIAFSVALAVMVAVATWCVVQFDLGHSGGWIILTILVVFQPSLGAGFTKAFGRASGTVLGFVVAIAVGAVLPTGSVLYFAGAVFLILSSIAMLQARPYWVFATFITAGIVLLESAGKTVDLVAEERLGATLIGVAGTLLVMLALSPFAKWLTDDTPPTPQPQPQK